VLINGWFDKDVWVSVVDSWFDITPPTAGKGFIHIRENHGPGIYSTIQIFHMDTQACPARPTDQFSASSSFSSSKAVSSSTVFKKTDSFERTGAIAASGKFSRSITFKSTAALSASRHFSVSHFLSASDNIVASNVPLTGFFQKSIAVRGTQGLKATDALKVSSWFGQSESHGVSPDLNPTTDLERSNMVLTKALSQSTSFLLSAVWVETSPALESNQLRNSDLDVPSEAEIVSNRFQSTESVSESGNYRESAAQDNSKNFDEATQLRESLIVDPSNHHNSNSHSGSNQFEKSLELSNSADYSESDRLLVSDSSINSIDLGPSNALKLSSAVPTVLIDESIHFSRSNSLHESDIVRSSSSFGESDCPNSAAISDSTLRARTQMAKESSTFRLSFLVYSVKAAATAAALQSVLWTDSQFLKYSTLLVGSAAFNVSSSLHELIVISEGSVAWQSGADLNFESAQRASSSLIWIIVAAVLCLAAVVGLIWYVARHRKKDSTDETSDLAEMTTDPFGPGDTLQVDDQQMRSCEGQASFDNPFCVSDNEAAGF
jgi:hypothetical protein